MSIPASDDPAIPLVVDRRLIVDEFILLEHQLMVKFDDHTADVSIFGAVAIWHAADKVDALMLGEQADDDRFAAYLHEVVTAGVSCRLTVTDASVLSMRFDGGRATLTVPPSPPYETWTAHFATPDSDGATMYVCMPSGSLATFGPPVSSPAVEELAPSANGGDNG